MPVPSALLRAGARCRILILDHHHHLLFTSSTMPADPQSTALLAHVVAQTKANIDFLVSQNYLLANDASGVLSKLSTLESEADAASNPVLSAAERTRQLALTDGPPGFTGMPTPSRPQSPPKAVMPTRRAVLPPRPSRSPAPRVQRARALWDYNENGTVSIEQTSSFTRSLIRPSIT